MSQGMTGSRSTWESMKDRCHTPSNPTYKNYGGRGIKICERWLVYENFLADMGERPEGTTIDRINNDGNYEPGNCRWATANVQSRNRRTNNWITAWGETKCITDWSIDPRCVVSINLVHKRITKLEWPAEKAISTPRDPNRTARRKTNDIKTVTKTRECNMTKRQESIHQWIKEYLTKHSYAPTLREIAKAFEIKSPNGVMCHLKSLREQGKVTWVEGDARTLVAV
jgi:LexA DNA binding domain-containing protein